jgi:hypothetical protein
MTVADLIAQLQQFDSSLNVDFFTAQANSDPAGTLRFWSIEQGEDIDEDTDTVSDVVVLFFDVE